MPSSVSSSEIFWSIQKLDTLGRVLYLAAHPDDENTGLISYLSLGKKLDVAYLSLTRGDGGQNLIGPELRESLGVIRTQELLAARRLDGGKQFFSRAIDFGYSKHSDETLEIWDEEAVLSDVVWVIRNFQPDVIVTRFGPEPGVTHGHHTASCLLAMEAFEAAADVSRFPEQLSEVEPWQAKRVVWNIGPWYFRNSGKEFNPEDYSELEIGGYDAVLGRSYNEVASVSRSQHRSQGFGARIDRGSRKEYFLDLVGDAMEGGLLDDVVTDWSRVGGASEISETVRALAERYDIARPMDSLPLMLKLHGLLEESDSVWAKRKQRDLQGIMLRTLGVDLKVLADEPQLFPKEEVALVLEGINRSGAKVSVSKLQSNLGLLDDSIQATLPENERIEVPVAARLSDELELSQPYWLKETGSLGMFKVEDQSLIGRAENEYPFWMDVDLEVEGVAIPVHLPVSYREVDPAQGERISPVVGLPVGSVSFSQPVVLFPEGEEREVVVTVKAFQAGLAGELALDLPKGWRATPEAQNVPPLAKGETREVVFRLKGAKGSGNRSISVVWKTNEGTFSKGVEQIEYPHIPTQYLFPDASFTAVSLELSRLGEKVAYVQGAGDSVARNIAEMGYEVTELGIDEVKSDRLQEFDAVVLGIRALNTLEEIDLAMPEIFDYVHSGGTAIVQYNTNRGLKTEQLAPYPISLSRDRVTDELAEVTLVSSEHPAMLRPNRIEKSDFEGWTQERGLYFPDRWDPAFTPILSMSDKGESPSEGSLLIARYGKGYYVYTGLSWFRQLPAGVPGAYRIFANLLSLGQEGKDK